MKKLLTLTVGILLLGACALASWDDAVGRGLIPYWQTGGNWFTMFTFVNTSEETSDVIYIRFFDRFGDGCSDTTGNVYPIRHGEMLIFSTTAAVPVWIPYGAGYGYVEFRLQGGGFIQTFCAIYNQANCSGYTVPAYHQDAGF